MPGHRQNGILGTQNSGEVRHNVWDPAAKRSRVQVVYNFGREEPGTREALERLVASVARHLDPGRARPAEGLARWALVSEQVCAAVAFAHARAGPPRPQAVQRHAGRVV